MTFKIIGIMFLIMTVMTGGFYWYYRDSQARISTLTQNNAQLETAVSITNETISSLQEDYKSVTEELSKINSEFREIRVQNNELRDRLGKSDIGALGEAKPGLVERIINNATTKAGRCFEILSGAPLSKGEKNAESSREFNSECPWLWPGSTVTSRVQ